MLKFGKQVFKLDAVDSTNNFAAKLINQGLADNGAVVMAEFQSDGKGQRGNKWTAAKGMNLTASFVFFPDNMALNQIIAINWWVSLCIVKAIAKYGLTVKIKWPNDIYADNVKLGGILIETSNTGSNVKLVVIGVGLNVNQTDFGDLNATSIKQKIGNDTSIEDLCWTLCDMFSNNYSMLSNPLALRELYVHHLFRLSVESTFIFQGEKQKGMITGIDMSGRLIVAFKHGIEALEHGQITWVLPTQI